MEELAWLDCPYGKINDPYPGQCELYTDTNSDRLCDYSQPAPAGGEGREGPEGVEGLDGTVVFLTLAIYLIHWYLSHKTAVGEKFKFLNRAAFRYFWNLILLLTFIPVAVSGLLLVFGVTNFDFNLWHNRAGLIFVTVAALHLLGRLGYFVKLRRFFITTF